MAEDEKKAADESRAAAVGHDYHSKNWRAIFNKNYRDLYRKIWELEGHDFQEEELDKIRTKKLVELEAKAVAEVKKPVAPRTLPDEITSQIVDDANVVRAQLNLLLMLERKEISSHHNLPLTPDQKKTVLDDYNKALHRAEDAVKKDPGKYFAQFTHTADEQPPVLRSINSVENEQAEKALLGAYKERAVERKEKRAELTGEELAKIEQEHKATLNKLKESYIKTHPDPLNLDLGQAYRTEIGREITEINREIKNIQQAKANHVYVEPKAPAPAPQVALAAPAAAPAMAPKAAPAPSANPKVAGHPSPDKPHAHQHVISKHDYKQSLTILSHLVHHDRRGNPIHVSMIEGKPCANLKNPRLTFSHVVTENTAIVTEYLKQHPETRPTSNLEMCVINSCHVNQKACGDMKKTQEEYRNAFRNMNTTVNAPAAQPKRGAGQDTLSH